MTEENGKTPEQQQAHINVLLTPQGAVLQFPVNVGLDTEMLDSLCEQWIMSRPLLLQKLAERALKAKQQELAIIKHVNRSKVN